MTLRKLWDYIVNVFRSREPSAADLDAKAAKADKIIGQVQRETEKLNDRIEKIMHELVDGMRR